MFDYFEDRAAFWIVLELCTGGELMDRIIQSTSFSERVAARYFRQMLEGLLWCQRAPRRAQGPQDRYWRRGYMPARLRR